MIELGVVGSSLCRVVAGDSFPCRAATTNRRNRLVDVGALRLAVTNLYDVNFFTYAGGVTFWPILGVVARRYGSARASSTMPTKTLRLLPVVALSTGLLTVSVLHLPDAGIRPSDEASSLLAADLGLFDQERSFWQEAESFGPLPLEHRYRAAVSRLSPGGPAQEGVMLLEEDRERRAGFLRRALQPRHGTGEARQYREALEWIDRHLAAYPGDSRAIEARVALLNRTLGLESRSERSRVTGRGTQSCAAPGARG